MNNNKTFCGLDVCKNRVVAWIASDRPRNIKQHFKQEVKQRDRDPEKDKFTFYYNKGGMSRLFELKFDAIVLEPTGVHYSTLPFIIAQSKGIEVLWVGHQQVANFRRTHKLPDKNDLADAYILSIYAVEHYGKDDYFLYYPCEKIARIKELYLQIKFSCRVSTSLIARLKQQLAHEFPEAMDSQIKRQKDGRSPLICWLAQRERKLQRKVYYWDNRYKESVAPEYDIEISQFTRTIAGQIDDCHQHRHRISTEMSRLVNSPEFVEYNRVFDEFMFDPNLRALLLAMVYPISNFATESQFKRRVGATKEENSSGDSVSWKTGNGSVLCHSQLYLWVLSNIAHPYGVPKRHGAVSEVFRRVQTKYDTWLERFNGSDDYVEQIIKEKTQRVAIRTVEKVLKNIFGTVLKKDADPLIRLTIEQFKVTMAQCFLSTQNKEKVPINKTQAKIKLGRLIIGKCIAYTARLLYKELRRRV